MGLDMLADNGKSICEERGISEKFKFKQDFWVDKETKPQLTLSATFFANILLSVVESIGKWELKANFKTKKNERKYFLWKNRAENFFIKK